MAKLTATFDIKDKMSKKLRSITGNFEAVEKRKKSLEKPMVLKARDEATKKINAISKTAKRELSKRHAMTVSINDRASKHLDKISYYMKKKMPRTHSMIVKAQDRSRSVLEKINRYLNRHLTAARIITILAKDRASPIMSRIANYAKRQLQRGYNFSVRAIDIASKTVGRIAALAKTAIPKYRDFTIRAIDTTSRVIGSVKRALFSIPSVITVTLAVVGVNKLKDATIGAAMNFEDYSVSMDHWLRGNKKAAAELMDWMGKKADKTPYSSPDIFPAMVGAVSLAGNNLPEIQRLTSAAIDMASLTPGRTVEEAMQALKNANMGEFTMMQGFGMKISKKDFDKMGWEGFVKEVEKEFQGGAEKLSATNRGIIATLQGYRGSLFRSMGQGFMEPMKPRLKAISDWLDNNQDKWGQWKKTVSQAGEQASEWLFSKLEKGFSHIRSNYLENDEFKKLDFEGKIKFILDDLNKWWKTSGGPAFDKWWSSTGQPWVEKIGISVGTLLFKGIVAGAKEGIKSLGGMWTDAFKNPSWESFGGAAVATVIAGSIATLIVDPLVKAFRLGKKVLWDVPKSVYDVLRGGPKTKKTPTGPVPISEKGPKPQRAPKTPVYTNPWFGKGEKVKLNVPNAKEASRFSKFLSGTSKFAKRVPVLGTALGALTIATASKDKKGGAIGGVTGGLAGAAAGAAAGSVVPVVGTAIGGLVGGILGATGGEKLGQWFQDNWSSIKQGASDTGKWISDKFGQAADWTGQKWSSFTEWSTNAGNSIKEQLGNATDWTKEKWSAFSEWSSGVGNSISEGFGNAVEWTKDKWSAFSGWFDESVWTPISDAAINTMNFMVGIFDIGREWASEKWSGFSAWFDESVWQPVKEGAQAAGQWISDKYSEAKEWTLERWTDFSQWFTDTVWEPVKEGAAIAGQWISDKYSDAKEWTSETWSTFSSWFDESVWEPVKLGAAVAGLWISERYAEAKGWISENWSAFSGWFEESVWTPVKTGAQVAGQWISDRYNEAKTWTQESWASFSGWFDTTVWTPIKTGAETAGQWISDKYDAAKTTVETAWGAVSGWFEDTVWSPIKSGSEAAADWIGSVFDSAKDKITGAWEWAKGKWDDVKSWGSGVTKRGEEITGVTPSKKYANGGYINRPHLGLVGEAGPEMIIPLSQSKRARALSLYEQTGKALGVRAYANGGQVGGSVKVPTTQPVQASVNVGSVSVQGMDKEAKLYGESFTNAIASGINGKVVSLNAWKKNNIENPMQDVVNEAVGFGASTVTSFSSGQNATTTNTAAYLDRQVKTPFTVIQGGASQWGAGTVSGFRSGQNATQTGTRPYLVTNVHTPFDETRAKGSSWGSGTAGEFVAGMRAQSGQVAEAAKYLAQQVEKTFRQELGIASPSKVMMKHGMWTAMGIVKGLGSVDIKKFAEKQAGSLAAAFAGMGMIGGNIREWIMAAMMITGVPSSWLGPLSVIAQKESGGNPRAINLWDINAKRGIPSKGLMQTIGPTFNAYKGKGLNDIWNPIHNAVAAINYIKSRYGNVFNVPGIKSMARGGPYKGYAKGGRVPNTQWAWVGEEGPELMRLPGGAEIYPHDESMRMASDDIWAEQVAVAIGSSGKFKAASGKVRDIILQITGDNHFYNEQDLDNFVAKVKRALEEILIDEYNEGGELVVYE